MKKTTLLTSLAVIMGLFILTSCEKDNDEMTTVKDMTVAEYVSYDPNFSILLQALYKADLANVLQGEGNFTVFAPTNDAFNALFTQLGVSGISDLSKETLTPILLYHVLGEEKKAASLSDGYINTLSPAQTSYASLKISTMGGVKLNKDINVVAADVDVKNGVIHAIDKVLLPPTVVDIALANESFSILVQAVVKAGLVETLSGAGPFTIFAPTNAAFEKLFTTLGISGINDLTAAQLIPVLTYHVVSGNVRSNQLSAGPVATLNGNINVTLSPSPAINSTSKIIATDVQASNGVIHVIDEVLLPAE
ncbi:MAG: fasciclin domain-containing protein [Bacteroidales bacterium]|jgi:transforming growth factor-beta-induced protein|nr:fasciclin domain-containing protein [Bacteroidales bacterium]